VIAFFTFTQIAYLLIDPASVPLIHAAESVDRSAAHG
jgi:hypothetical protein